MVAAPAHAATTMVLKGRISIHLGEHALGDLAGDLADEASLPGNTKELALCGGAGDPSDLLQSIHDMAFVQRNTWLKVRDAMLLATEAYDHGAVHLLLDGLPAPARPSASPWMCFPLHLIQSYM